MTLRKAQSGHLVDSLIEELQAWTVEPFDDDRIAEFDAGVLEIARRADITEGDARVWLAKQATKKGVEV